MAEQYDRLLLRRAGERRGKGRGLAHRGDFDVGVGIARRLEHAGVIGGEFGHLAAAFDRRDRDRSEEHTSELQSLMRISYAVFCLKKKNKKKNTQNILLTADIQQVIE